MKSFANVGTYVAMSGLFAIAPACCYAAESSSPATEAVSAHSQAVDPLMEKVEEAIAITGRRYLDVKVHTPWQMMHGLLALRGDYLLKADGNKVNAVDWMSGGATFKGEAWFQKTRQGGRAHPFKYAYAFEGHPNQFLAIFAMADLPLEHEFKIPGNKSITIHDMVRHAQAEETGRKEVTWTLWALSHYLGSEARWENKHRQPWSIERLVQVQTNEPVHNAACGGTHAMFALSYARNTYVATQQPMRGVWLEADQKIKRYLAVARSYQGRDGMLSSNYFRSRGSARDFKTRLSTCGHALEFVMVALPQSRLNEKWVRNALNAVAQELIDHRADPLECGALYHGLNGLVIYRERMRPEPNLADATEAADVGVEVDVPQPPLEQPVEADRPGL